MKKTFLVVFAALLSFGVVSCGKDKEPSSSKPIPPTSEVKPVEPSVEVKEDFTVKLTCDAGQFKQESYSFVAKEFHLNPNLEIEITSSLWVYTTAYYEDKLKLLSENKDVIPDEALQLHPQYRHQSNFIIGFNIYIDLDKVNPGTTNVKVFIKPSNGSTSAENIELCVPVTITQKTA